MKGSKAKQSKALRMYWTIFLGLGNGWSLTALCYSGTGAHGSNETHTSSVQRVDPLRESSGPLKGTEHRRGRLEAVAQKSQLYF